MEWYSFISEAFSGNWQYLKVRDRVVSVCSNCGYHSVVIVRNLKTQVKKIGTHLCWSCSAREGRAKADSKYKTTMLKKYGVEYPLQNPKICKKFHETKLTNQNKKVKLKKRGINE